MDLRQILAHPRSPWLIVAGLTALFLAAGLSNLGAVGFPSSGWAGDGEAVLDLGSVQRVDRVFLAVLDPEPLKAAVSCGAPGAWSVPSVASAQGYYRQWASATTRCDTRYVRLNFTESRATVAEVVAVRDLEVVPVAGVEGPPGAGRLSDEAALATEAPTYLHGAYFDEIYFMRTADEYLRRAPPFFEWTHPPLAKDLVALSILVAGNGPFGWRLLGVLAGAAAIPAAYLLGRNLLGNRRAGIVSAALVTFDFMHFAQARIATGEIFLFLFLTGMWAFFAAWWMAPREKLVRKEAAIWKHPLFLALALFGLALSVKVVAVNSLAALLLLALARVWRERDLFRASLRPFAAGVAVAGAIYLSAYAPYYASGLGLGEVLSEQCCGPRSIFAYHATLEAPHPYGSPWWSWPLLLHPLWMHGETFGSQVSTIVSMGNPAVWWAGLLFVLLALPRVRQERAALFIVAVWAIQWAAFAPIGRVLFIYHYFPNVAILALGCAWGVEREWARDPKRGLWLAAGLIGAAALLFALFYPVISGTPTDSAYKEALRWIRFGFPLWWGKNHGQPASWDF
ncbi:MAG: phospholipid carrier-dependent glycosyltransferase [Halobacteria archaeon]